MALTSCRVAWCQQGREGCWVPGEPGREAPLKAPWSPHLLHATPSMDQYPPRRFCIKHSVACRLREVVLPCCSALGRPCLEYFVQFWAPRYNRDLGIPEGVKLRATKMTEGLGQHSSEERLRELGLMKGKISGGISSMPVVT